MRILIFLFIILINQASAQNIAAVKRGINSFYVFDNGVLQQLEHRPVKSFAEGGDFLAYINDANEFKIYRNGRSFFLDEGAFINTYTATNHLISFIKENQLSVWDNNRIKILSTWIAGYTVTDSLVAFTDDLLKTFKVYYNNSVYDLETYLDSTPSLTYKAGKNTLAYLDRNYNFYIFHHGKKELITKFHNKIKFDSGTDIVAFEAENEYLFQIFYKGEVLGAAELKPVNFEAGDGIVAFTDVAGNFKVFDNGIQYTVSKFSPSFYDVEDNIVIFADTLHHFSAFINGRIHQIEEMQPQSYKADAGNIAYIDHIGRFKFFSRGKTSIVSYEKVINYRLNGEVIVYDTGEISDNIWFNGKAY